MQDYLMLWICLLLTVVISVLPIAGCIIDILRRVFLRDGEPMPIVAREVIDTDFRIRRLALRSASSHWRAVLFVGISIECLRLVIAIFTDSGLAAAELAPSLLTLGAMVILAIVVYVIDLRRARDKVKNALDVKDFVADCIRTLQATPGNLSNDKYMRIQRQIFGAAFQIFQRQVSMNAAAKVMDCANENLDIEGTRDGIVEIVITIANVFNADVLPILTDAPLMSRIRLGRSKPCG